MIRTSLENMEQIERVMNFQRLEAYDIYRSTISLEFTDESGDSTVISAWINVEYGYFGQSGYLEARTKGLNDLRKSISDEIAATTSLSDGIKAESNEAVAEALFRSHGESFNNWLSLVEAVLISHFKPLVHVDERAIALAPIKLIAIFDCIRKDGEGSHFEPLLNFGGYQLGIEIEKIRLSTGARLSLHYKGHTIQGALLQLDSDNIEESIRKNIAWLTTHARLTMLEEVEVKPQVEWIIEVLQTRKELLHAI